MCRIAIIKITVVDPEGSRTSQPGRYVLEKTELEEYRESIIRDGNNIARVLFTYEEVGDD